MISKLYKLTGETRTYAVDFAAQVEIADGGQTLTGAPTVVVTRKSGTGTLTPGSPTISTTKVVFTLVGGAEGDRHLVTVTVATSGGSTLQSVGELKIQSST